MKVLCPASWQKRRVNRCDTGCSHFLPHPKITGGPDTNSCVALKNAEGYVVCPACIRTTPKSVKKAMVAALVQKMTKTFDYDGKEEDNGR